MVEINNLTSYKVDEELLKRAAESVLKQEKKKKGLSLALVGQKRIKELNRKYRSKDKATDVLSFKYDDSGEVVICPAIIRKKAEEDSLLFKKALTGTLIHGILHLLGYSHKTMKNKEEHYLSKIRF